MGATALLSLGLIALPGYAQSVPQQVGVTDTASGADGAGLEEIIVTSQRRSERLQDVPISVTALNSADLAQNGVDDISRLEMLTPGFSFGKSGSDARPAIRGVRTETISAPNDPSIGFYLDGVYQSRAQQALIPLVDIDRVEVQRGPQGTLYGRNTFGGNISVITKVPTDQTAAEINLEVGDYNLRRVEGFLNLPLNDKVQVRISGDRTVEDGYVTSTHNPNININDKDETDIRAAIRLLPTDDLEILIRGGYWKNTGDGGGAYGYKVLGTLVNSATGLRSVYGVAVPYNPTVKDGIVDRYGADIGVPVTSDPYKNDWDYEPYEDTEEKYATAQINWNVDDFAVLRSITGFTRFRSDRTADLDQSGYVFPAPGITAGFAASGLQENDTNVQTSSEELQLASQETEPLQWVVGTYGIYDRIREPYSQYYTAPTATAVDTRTVTQVDTTAYAGYAQGSYYVLPDQLRLTAGARYTTETKKYDIANFNIPEIGGVVSAAPIRTTAAQGAPTFKKTIYRVDADYFLAKENMLYANISTGFRSGGLNNNTSSALIPASFGPETVTAYEVGTKNRFLENRLQLNAALFYYDFKNLQISILDPTTNLSYTRNAGAATSEGGEISFEALPVAQWKINGSVSYMDAIYTSYTRPNDFYTAANGDPRLVSFKGNEIPMSPRWKTTLGVDYTWDIGNLGAVIPYAVIVHSSHYYGTDYNTPLDRQGSYTKLDLSLSWRSQNDLYSAELYAHNVTDVAVLNRAVLGNNQRIQGSYEPPRMIGFTVGARY